jgi:hypothetical protein
MDKKEYQIKKTHIIKMNEFYKKIIKETKKDNKDESSNNK